MDIKVQNILKIFLIFCIILFLWLFLITYLEKWLKFLNFDTSRFSLSKKILKLKFIVFTAVKVDDRHKKKLKLPSLYSESITKSKMQQYMLILSLHDNECYGCCFQAI